MSSHPGFLKINGKVNLGKREMKLKVLLGETSNVQIFLVKDTKTEERFTLVLFCTTEKAEGVECEKQINLFKNLNSKYIARLLFADFSPVSRDLNNYHFLFELSPTTLQLEYDAYIDSEERMTEARVLDIFDDVLNAVIILHSKAHPVFLLKLAMENIIHTKEGVYKLFDLRDGLEEIVSVSGLTPTKEAELTSRITHNIPPSYRSPEIVHFLTNKKGIESDVQINATADIWQLGCLLYRLLFYKGPFDGDSDDATHTNILNNRYDFPDQASWERDERNRIRNSRVIKTNVSKHLSKDKVAHLTDIKQLLTYFWDRPPPSRDVTNAPATQLLSLGPCGSSIGVTGTGRQAAIITGQRPVYSKSVHALIDFMLEPNPLLRPTALHVLQKLYAMTNRSYPPGWPIPPPPHPPTNVPKHLKVFNEIPSSSPDVKDSKETLLRSSSASSVVTQHTLSSAESASVLADTNSHTDSKPSKADGEGEEEGGAGGGGEDEEDGGGEHSKKEKQEKEKERRKKEKEQKKKEKEQKRKDREERHRLKKARKGGRAELENELRSLRAELDAERRARENEAARRLDHEQDLLAEVTALATQVARRDTLLEKKDQEKRRVLAEIKAYLANEKKDAMMSSSMTLASLPTREAAVRRREDLLRTRETDADTQAETIKRLEGELRTKREHALKESEDKRRAINLSTMEISERETDLKRSERTAQGNEEAVVTREQNVNIRSTRIRDLLADLEEKERKKGGSALSSLSLLASSTASSAQLAKGRQLNSREVRLADRERSTARREAAVLSKEDEMERTRTRHARTDLELLQKEEDNGARQVTLEKREFELSERSWKIEEVVMRYQRASEILAHSSSSSFSSSSYTSPSHTTTSPSSLSSSATSRAGSSSSSSSSGTPLPFVKTKSTRRDRKGKGGKGGGESDSSDSDSGSSTGSGSGSGSGSSSSESDDGKSKRKDGKRSDNYKKKKEGRKGGVSLFGSF